MNGLKKIWKVAIYARVSTDKKEQQESIPAQSASLQKWLLEKSKEDKEAVYNLIEVYEDQGFSGSNFERDSFIRMKEDIEKGKINMILTRDLSRFARNYVVAGYYLEDYFKENGVRFVSVLDNVDTIEEVNDIVPFKNILNEMYIKDCSRRTRDGLKQRMIRGSSIASKPPYGYEFKEVYDGNVKNIKLASKEDETTEVVREIFNLYIQGWGMGSIATHLNNKGIEPPSAQVKNFAKGKFGLWTNNTIRYILTNPKYGGIMVQGRWKKVSYKIKKVKTTPKDEWIVGGEFEGIVSRDVFEKVQELIKKRSKNFRHKGGNVHLFSGVLKCNECGGSMSYRARYKGYKCTNSQMGGGRCTAHSIKEEYLKEIIKSSLKMHVQKMVNPKELYKLAEEKVKNEDNYEKELKKIEKELKKLDFQVEKTYMHRLEETISKRNFHNLISGIQKKQEHLINRKEELESLKKSCEDEEKLYQKYKEKIDRILNFEEFDRVIIESLIDKIIVSEDKDTREKVVDIYYKFRY